MADGDGDRLRDKAAEGHDEDPTVVALQDVARVAYEAAARPGVSARASRCLQRIAEGLVSRL